MLALLVAGAACSSVPKQQPPAALAPCDRLDLPVAVAGEPPPAVMQDVAAANTEYVLGVPGDKPEVLKQATVGVPRLVGGGLWLTRAEGAAEVEEVNGLSCHRIAPGDLLEVSPHGKEIAASLNPQTQVLLDSSGRRLAKLAPQVIAWFADDRAVAINGTTVRVYSGGHASTVPHDSAVQIIATLGSDRLVETKARSTQLMTLTGQVSPLIDELLQPAAGSPDGRYVAGLDPYVDRLLLVDAGSGKSATLPNPGGVLSVRWSADSQWLAVVGRYGGSVIHIPDGRAISLGSLNVLSW